MTNADHSNASMSELDIERLIPHRLPMRLVEEVVKVDEVSIETRGEVRTTWPTARDGHASTVLLAEFVAQSAAALQGWKERHEKSAAIGGLLVNEEDIDHAKAELAAFVGLLVGIPASKATAATIPLGTRLCCTVNISHGATNYLAFEGQVHDEVGRLWSKSSIQAYRPDDLVLPGVSP